MPEPLDPSALDHAADPELGWLLSSHPDIEPLRYLDGERLVTEGEASQEVFLVHSGCLVVEKALPSGASRTLAHLECRPEAPAIVGEMAYFGAQRRTATVRAVGSCKVLRLLPSHLDSIMASAPGLAGTLCRQFTSRLQEANDELKDLQARQELEVERRMTQPGEVLFTRGQRADTLFQLVMGSLRLDSDQGSRLWRSEDLPQGFLGLEAFLRGSTHSETAITEEACFLAAIRADRREAFLRSYPGLVLEILAAPSSKAEPNSPTGGSPKG